MPSAIFVSRHWTSERIAAAIVKDVHRQGFAEARGRGRSVRRAMQEAKFLFPSTLLVDLYGHEGTDSWTTLTARLEDVQPAVTTLRLREDY